MLAPRSMAAQVEVFNGNALWVAGGVLGKESSVLHF